jgi:hypothetical protein
MTGLPISPGAIAVAAAGGVTLEFVDIPSGKE